MSTIQRCDDRLNPPTFPAGLAPVHIDRTREVGTYWEPNVWIVHPIEVTN
jgi:hypothetical protein